MTLYHLTSIDNVDSILKNGLQADEDNCIFLFTDMIVANEIAKRQVFLSEYAVFAVDPAGIHGELESDQIGEFTQNLHRIAMQPLIAPIHLSYLGIFQTIIDRPTEWDYLCEGNLMGYTREQVDEVFERMRATPDATT